MKSQWECLLQNLGEWKGSFTGLSPQGEILEDIPSFVSLEGLNNNQLIRQTIRLGEKEKILEYGTLGRGVLFFENGAFSQGTVQLGPFSEFGAELGLIYKNRRLRLVQLFDSNGQIDKLTLIREYLVGTSLAQRPPLTLEALLGFWQGQAVTAYPDWRSGDTYSTSLQLQLGSDGRIIQSLSFNSRTITSSATFLGSRLIFDQDPQKQVQLLLLPDGASATFPLKVQWRQAFLLEVGWLLEPCLRQRMIRSYNEKGEWVSLTLVTEKKIQQ